MIESVADQDHTDGVQTRSDIVIDWRIPATPPGWRGALARFLGPGKTRGEGMVELAGGVLVAGLLTVLLWRTDALRGWSGWQIAVLAVMVFDLLGGFLTTATNSGKRWYHRPEPGMRGYRIKFVSSHVLYLLVVAYLILPNDTGWLLLNTAVLVISAVLIELSPLHLKRPVAMALYVSAILVGSTWFSLPATLAWFPVLFYLKLLVSFMVPEAPMKDRPSV